MKFHLVLDIDTGKEPLTVADLHDTLSTLAAVVRDNAEREPSGACDKVALVAPTREHPVWRRQLVHFSAKIGKWKVEESESPEATRERGA